MKKTLLAIALSSVLLSGCVISIDDDRDFDSASSMSWSELEAENRSKISRLDIGDSLSSVRDMLGVPDFNELMKKGDKEYRVLYFRTQRREGDGATTKDECTPVIFVDGILQGIGDESLDILLS